MTDASDPTQSQSAGVTQPGWYPDPTNGQLRWWDGQAWGAFQQGTVPAPAPAPYGAVGATDPTQSAMWAHYAGAGLLLFTCLFSWVGPLVVLSSSGSKDPFIKDQATEALNFQITVTIAAIISGILIFAFVGFVLFPLVVLGGIVLGFMGGQAASRGEWYRYPVSLRLVKGS